VDGPAAKKLKFYVLIFIRRACIKWMMHDDMALAHEYAARQSGQAFETLVSRHIGLVHSAALRQVRDPHLAEEITQTVFIILARKAGVLNSKTILPGWLYRTTRFTASAALKTQRRREHRELEAHRQAMIQEPQTDPVWEQLAPLLDEAMAQLRAQDRDALVLRYFQNRSLRDIGAALGVDEYAAQKRVGRALEKLRAIFVKRGAVSTSSIIAGALSANSVQAAPAVLAKTVTVVAMTKGVAASVSTLTLIKEALKIMAWTKMKTAIVVGASVLLAAGTGTVTIKTIATRKAEASWRVPFPNPDRAPSLVEILPTKFPASVDILNGGSRGDNWIGVGRSVFTIVQIAYNWRPGRILFADPQPKERYDFISTLRQGSGIALQAELKRKLGFVGHREMRDMDVLVLKVRRSNAPGLKPPTNGHTDHSRKDYYYCDNEPLSSDSGGASSGGYFTITSFLEGYFGTPVIDQTGLTQHFHIDFKWNEPLGGEARGGGQTASDWLGGIVSPGDPDHDALKHALLDQLGLELVPTNMPIEMLVVEKAK
jgi:uncharacterized protein (TIGR03435 family)